MNITNPKEAQEFAESWRLSRKRRGLDPARCVYLRRAEATLEEFLERGGVRMGDKWVPPDTLKKCLSIIRKAMK